MNPTHRQEEKRLLEVTGVEWVVLVFWGVVVIFLRFLFEPMKRTL